MGLNLQGSKPTELELRLADLEEDEDFRALPEEVQKMRRRAVMEGDDQDQRIRRIGRERYRSAMTLGVGMMVLFWGLGSAPNVKTFSAAVVLGLLLGTVMERIEGGTVLFALSCSLAAFLLGTLTGTFTSVFLVPIGASYIGAAAGTTRWP